MWKWVDKSLAWFVRILKRNFKFLTFFIDKLTYFKCLPLKLFRIKSSERFLYDKNHKCLLSMRNFIWNYLHLIWIFYERLKLVVTLRTLLSSRVRFWQWDGCQITIVTFFAYQSFFYDGFIVKWTGQLTTNPSLVLCIRVHCQLTAGSLSSDNDNALCIRAQVSNEYSIPLTDLLKSLRQILRFSNF